MLTALLVPPRHACTSMERAFSPLPIFVVGWLVLGRWPRLVWDAPLALEIPSLRHLSQQLPEQVADLHALLHTAVAVAEGHGV
jgi:hypothetical protein